MESNIVLISEKVLFLENKIKKEITDAKSDLLERYPIKGYIELLGKYPDFAKFNYVSPEVIEFCREIIEDTDERILDKYHKLLLVVLIDNKKNELNNKTLPNEIKGLYYRSFERILHQIENDSEMPGPYNYTEDYFSKDLAICNLKIIPTGLTTFEYSRFPGKYLLIKSVLRKDFKEFTRIVSFIAFELKGKMVPFLESHYITHDPNFHSYMNLEGMIDNRRILAKLLKMIESIKGTFGVGWIADPQVAIVSPRLAYIHNFYQSVGYKYFFYEINEEGTRYAVSKSETRRRLYSEGKYIPKNYLIVISRKRLLCWAKKMKLDISDDD